MFDITNSKGMWLTSEGKIFFGIQIVTQGRAGCCSSKVADPKKFIYQRESETPKMKT